MAGRVNTKFVYGMAAVIASLIIALLLFWYLFVYQDIDEKIARGDELMQQGEVRLAIEYYGKALYKRREDVDLIMTVLDAYDKLPVKDIVEAREIVAKKQEWTRIATELRPSDMALLKQYYELMVDLAQQFDSIGIYTRLFQNANTKLETRPGNALARKYRGLAQANRLATGLSDREIEQARQDLAVALENDPDDSESAYHLALIHLHEADMLQRQGRSPQLVQKLFEQADQLTAHALEAHPDQPQVQINRLQVLTRLIDDTDTKLQNLRRARIVSQPDATNPVEPTSTDDHRAQLQARASELRDQANAIASDLEKRFSNQPEPERLVALLAELLPKFTPKPDASDNLAVGDHPGVRRSLALLENAVKAKPDSPLFHLLLGKLRNATGDKQSALTAFTKARQLGKGGNAIEAIRRQNLQTQATYEAANVLYSQAVNGDEQTRETLLSQIEGMITELRQMAGDSGAVLLLEGKVAQAKGDIGQAMIKYDLASQRYGDANFEALLLSARARRQLQEWGAAAERLETVLARRPNLNQVRLELAEIYLRGQDAAKAKRHLDLVLASDPDNKTARMLQANLLAQQGQLSEAVHSIEQFQQQDDAGDVTDSLARLYMASNQREKAIKLAQSQFEQDPTNLRVLQLLIQVTSDNDKRLELIEQARQAGADEKALSMMQNQIQAIQGGATTRELLEQLIEARDDPFSKAMATARLHLSAREFDAATQAIADAQAIKPNDPNLVSLKFDAALIQENWDTAQQAADQAGDLNIDLAQGAFFQARLALAREEQAKAIALLRQGLVARPVYSEGRRLLGDALVANGDLDGAIQAYETSLSQRPNNQAALRGLARAQAQRGQFDQALTTLERAYRFAPGQADLRESYLVFEARFGDPAKALRIRQQLAKRDPDNVGNQRAIIGLLAVTGQSQQAITQARELFKQDPTDIANVRVLLSVLQYVGQPQEGLQIARQFVADRGDEATTDDLRLLAQYQLSIDQFDDAVKTYQQAIEMEDASVKPVSRELADILFQRQEYSRAAQLYREVLETLPDDDRVRLRLAETYVQTDQFDDAQSLLSASDNQPMANAIRATMAIKQEDFAKGERLLNQVIRDDPKLAVSYYQRAVAVLAQEPDEARQLAAINDLTEALRLNPQLAPARQTLIQLRQARGEAAQAAEQLEQLVELQPNNAAARRALIGQKLAINDVLAARSLLAEAAEKFPDQDIWPRLQAQVAQRQQYFDQALSYWQKALNVNGNATNLAGVTGLLIQMQRPRDAFNLLQRQEFAQMVRQEPLLLAIKGRSLALLERPEPAVQLFEHAINRSQNLQQVLVVADQIYQALGGDAAISLLMGTREANQQSAMYAAAQLHIRQQQFAEAIAMIQRLQSSGDPLPEPMTAQLDRMLGAALYQLGRTEQARKTYEQILASRPDDFATANNLAFLLVEETQDMERALQLAQHAADLAPNNAQILDTLGWVQFKNGQVNAAQASLEQSLQITELAPTRLHMAYVLASKQRPREAADMLNRAIELAENTNDKQTLARAREAVSQLGLTEEVSQP